MFRKVMLFFLALAFCGLVVAGIDLARHAMAVRRLENAGAICYDWHYRFSAVAAAGYSDSGHYEKWHRMLAFPQRVLLLVPPPPLIVVNHSMLRDLALLGVKDIDFSDCRGLTPAMMSELSRNSSVRSLFVTGGDVTNEGVNLLWSGCPNLEAVQLNRKDIGDDAFRNVKAARALKLVALRKLAITDQTIAYLREAPRLEELVLDEVTVGEACGPLLAATPRLRRVTLHGMNTAAAIREKLGVLRPDVTVIMKP